MEHIILQRGWCVPVAGLKVFGLQRMYPLIHTTVGKEGLVHLGQMFFGLMLQLEEDILAERKKASVPGSKRQVNFLFSAEDIRNEKKQIEVSKASGVFPTREKRYYFQIDSGPKSYRWKSFWWQTYLWLAWRQRPT